MTEYEWLTCDKPLLMLRRLRERDAAIDGELHHLCLKKLGLSNVVIATESMGHVDKSSCDLIREVVGNPFRKIQTSYYAYYFDGVNEDKAKHAPEAKRFLYPWLTPRVQSFAQGIIESERYGDVPALADLLEEAGCDNEELLRHFRQEVMCPECDGHGEDPPGVTPWGDVISEWCPCNHCMRTGWLPKPVPCQPGCWALRLLTEESV